MRGKADLPTGLVVAVLCGVQFVDVLGVTSTTTAIPAMIDDLAAPAWSTALIATAYAAFFGGFLVVGARLGDRYGARRTLLAGLVLFVAIAFVGATADDVGQLLTARAGQGVAAAVSVPSALQILLRQTTSTGSRRSAVAAWGASGAAAGALGLFVGGLLTDSWGWRAIFWINVPIGVALIIGIALSAPVTPPEDDGARVDWPGAALLVVAVMGVVVAASVIEQPVLRTTGYGIMIGAVAVGALFVARQRRAANPLVPLAAFGSRNLRWGTILSFVNTATTSSAALLVVLHLQRQLGSSALEAGLRLMPLSLSVIVGSVIAKPIGDRMSDGQLAGLGLSCIAVGSGVLAVTGGSRPGVLVAVTIMGTGLGLAAVAATTIGTTVTDRLAGSATGLLNTGGQVGTAVGVAAFVTLAGVVPDPVAGSVTAWTAIAVLAGLTALATLSSCRRSLTASRHG